MQSNCVQQDAATTYSTLAVDNTVEFCFLLNQQDTNLEPI